MDLPTKDYDLPSSLNCWREQEEVEVLMAHGVKIYPT